MSVSLRFSALCLFLVYMLFLSVNGVSSMEEENELQSLIDNSTMADRRNEDIAIEKNDKAVEENPERVASMVDMSIRNSTERRKLGFLSCGTGNPIDDCWRCDRNWQRHRKRLADCAIGFGRNAIGGRDGRFKTIDARGVNVHIANGGCITIQYITNVIIHGLHIHDCKPTGNAMVRSSPSHYGWRTMADGDGISIFGSSHIWIDHNSLSNCADGLVDAIMGSTAITVSNNYFTHHNEVMLLGHSDTYDRDKIMQVTIAYNHFGEGLVQRMPRCRHGQGNRYLAPVNPNAKEVTHRVMTAGRWRHWNWRSEGDLMLNGAFFVPSGKGAGASYARASSLSAKPSSVVASLTSGSGALVCRRGREC
ncbi:unnamed protein product [Lactuca saligna]|uniref:Pectate lyase n=1 Tax=Lactuca saligna TaxID=75948 RepID=A0AA35ZXM6_LACSI|nr:unnamed protein product [Lactuca saligna]